MRKRMREDPRAGRRDAKPIVWRDVENLKALANMLIRLELKK
jgi:hypothetical protein